MSKFDTVNLDLDVEVIKTLLGQLELDNDSIILKHFVEDPNNEGYREALLEYLNRLLKEFETSNTPALLISGNICDTEDPNYQEFKLHYPAYTLDDKTVSPLKVIKLEVGNKTLNLLFYFRSEVIKSEGPKTQGYIGVGYHIQDSN